MLVTGVKPMNIDICGGIAAAAVHVFCVSSTPCSSDRQLSFHSPDDSSRLRIPVSSQSAGSYLP